MLTLIEARPRAGKTTTLQRLATLLQGEGTQNLLCACLAVATLVGLVANTGAGIWWLDPVAALFIGAACMRAGWLTWRGEECGCAACAAFPVG